MLKRIVRIHCGNHAIKKIIFCYKRHESNFAASVIYSNFAATVIYFQELSRYNIYIYRLRILMEPLLESDDNFNFRLGGILFFTILTFWI